MAIPRLHVETTALLVVDMQERLLPHMEGAEALTGQVSRLMDGAKVLGLPIVATEQYRKGLGGTVIPIAQRLEGAACVVEKLKFSACVEPVREALAGRGVRSVIVCGIEAHVCVLQTCLDLMSFGYVTAVAADAISSRRVLDKDVSLQRMIHTGVIATTVESALLEMLHEAGGERFKAMLGVVK